MFIKRHLIWSHYLKLSRNKFFITNKTSPTKLNEQPIDANNYKNYILHLNDKQKPNHKLSKTHVNKNYCISIPLSTLLIILWQCHPKVIDQANEAKKQNCAWKSNHSHSASNRSQKQRTKKEKICFAHKVKHK